MGRTAYAYTGSERRQGASGRYCGRMDDGEFTPGGSRIYHDEPREGLGFAESDDPLREEYETHYARLFGTEPTVWHEIVSPVVHVDVYLYPPTPERPHAVLATLGMSDLPMTVPEEVERWAANEGLPSLSRAEVMLALPADWPLTQEAFREEANYWPLRLLKQLARLPHEYGTWLGWGHTLPNGHPVAQPYHASAPFTGVMLASPTLYGDEASPFRIGERGGHLYAAIPLTTTEMDFKLQHGADALVERLVGQGVSELIDERRASVVDTPRKKRLFGLF